uniref:G domain-containing protein n=1 Tax=Timema monikensis TaxID=170555 RepID=A0A7R9HNJ6_9NEOP|nr:unnamed protein product [Timema monikensis]
MLVKMVFNDFGKYTVLYFRSHILPRTCDLQFAKFCSSYSKCYINEHILYHPQNSKLHFQKFHFIHTACPRKDKLSHKQSKSNLEYDSKFLHLKTKILYNSVFEGAKMKCGFVKSKILGDINKRAKINKLNNNLDNNGCVALKYLEVLPELNESFLKSSEIVNHEISKDSQVNLPYATHQPNLVWPNMESSTNHSDRDIAEKLSIMSNLGVKDERGPMSWMADYEHFDDAQLFDVSESVQSNYGTPDRSIPVSSVPCGGCGALLHCQDPGIPGYLPSELYTCYSKSELRSITCQRCHFMKHYNMALNVNVSPDEYPRLISMIQHCTSRPVVVVGNKVDLLPADCPGYLDHVKNCVKYSLESTGIDAANIKHIALVSASTGYGVEELITKLQNLWDYKGGDDDLAHHHQPSHSQLGANWPDHIPSLLVLAPSSPPCLSSAPVLVSAGVQPNLHQFGHIWGSPLGGDVYLIGCTNVGKSTLFNALLQSDYCKVKAVDLIQRATTSPWPGTTLNLLKFPILRPEGWRLYERTKRLLSNRSRVVVERKLRRLQTNDTNKPDNPTLIGHIDRTFLPKPPEEKSDPFSVSQRAFGGPMCMTGLDPHDKDFSLSRWCYDTPGTVQPDQVRDIVFQRRIKMFTVFAAGSLPITVCRITDADYLYSELLGSELLAVPSGGSARLQGWPGLTSVPHPLQVKGLSWTESCADIVLSSAGWIAITSGPNVTCQLRAWTPDGRGVYLRQPALLRYAVNMHSLILDGSSAVVWHSLVDRGMTATSTGCVGTREASQD